MPIYTYETVPPDAATSVRRFELRQGMKDPALTHDPETGMPVRRVITGGLGYLGPRKGSGGMVASCDTGTCCPECHD